MTTNFLVAFNASGSLLTNIYGQFVSPAGTLIRSNVLIDGTVDPSDNPLAVAFDGRNYFVVFNDEVGGVTNGVFRVFGRFLDPFGTLQPGRYPVGDGDFGRQLWPSLACDGSSYLVSWCNAKDLSNLSVAAQFISPTGQPLGPSFVPIPAQGTNQPMFAVTVFDRMDYLVSEFMVTYTNRPPGDVSSPEPASADVYSTFLPGSTAPPRISVAGSLAVSGFPLLVTGTPGIQYAIQAAQNLVPPDWTSLITNSPTNGPFAYTDTAPWSSNRFYRAVSR